MKARFKAVCGTAPEVMAAQQAHARSLNLPEPWKAGGKRLAVVGGGPSILKHMDDIKNFDGEKWIAASAWHKVSQYTDGVFFNIDPSEQVAPMAQGAKRAILATCTHPSVFEALKDADVRTFDLRSKVEKNNHFGSTVTAAPDLGINCGYEEVVFFGCEASWVGDTHAYKSVRKLKQNRMEMTIACDGKKFTTSPDFFIQAEYLSALIRAAPHYFKEESGGLLRGLVNDPDYSMTWYCDELKAILVPSEFDYHYYPSQVSINLNGVTEAA